MNIVIKKNELEKVLAQISENSWIELRIVPSQFDCGTRNPALLHIGQFNSDGAYEDMESISEFGELKSIHAC